MKNTSPDTLVTDFIAYVNQGDLEKVNTYLSPEIKFTDIQGRVYYEPEFMENYLKAFSKYKIHIHHVLRGGDGVAVIGHTSGSHVAPDIEENEVLVWTAEMEDGLIAEWRIYSTERYADSS
jgi:hypothetical protein